MIDRLIKIIIENRKTYTDEQLNNQLEKLALIAHGKGMVSEQHLILSAEKDGCLDLYLKTVKDCIKEKQ